MKSATVLMLFILSLIALAFALQQRSVEPTRIEPVVSAVRDAAARPSGSPAERNRDGGFELGSKTEPLRQLDIRTLERSAKVPVAEGQSY